MKVLIAGATGVIGRQLVPKLIANGHEVAGTTTTSSKEPMLREMGATPFVVDILDPEAVARAVADFEPDVIVHEATALSSVDMRHFERSFAVTNRLRTEGIDHLLAAGRAVGVKRFVAQSFAGWPFARTGSLVKTEDDPLDPNPIDAMRTTHRGDPPSRGGRHRCGLDRGHRPALRRAVRTGHVARQRRWRDDRDDPPSLLPDRGRRQRDVLVHPRRRCGRCHPGRGRARHPGRVPHRRRRAGADAGVAAGRGRSARRQAAASRIPRWLGRLVGGEMVVAMSTETRGASNERAKRVLGWTPRHASWRESLGQAAA